MVHALEESWRVVRIGGSLIDLRPLASGWPLDLVGRRKEMLAGRLDDKMRIREDNASNEAISEALNRGRFKLECEEYFDYAYYWNTVEEMVEYVEADWWNSAVVPDEVVSEARRLVQLADERVDIRIRRTMVIARYRKLAKDK